MPFKNEDDRKEYRKKYYWNHREQALEVAKDYHQKHKTEHRKACQRYRKKNKEKIKKSRRKYYENNIILFKIEKAKRRSLGFEALNEPFENCVGHHLDKNFIVYIPKRLHSSVYHNVWTGRGMDEINGKALIWIGKNYLSKNIKNK